MSRQVLCYDINTGEAEVVYTSENDGFLYLCYDGISLFIIEKSDDENNRFYEMSVSDNQFVKSFVLPSEFCNYGEYIITEGFILNGRESESELVVYDIDTESGCYISRGK